MISDFAALVTVVPGQLRAQCHLWRTNAKGGPLLPWLVHRYRLLTRAFNATPEALEDAFSDLEDTVVPVQRSNEKGRCSLPQDDYVAVGAFVTA